MIELSRRTFLQLMGAGALAPLLPAEARAQESSVDTYISSEPARFGPLDFTWASQTGALLDMESYDLAELEIDISKNFGMPVVTSTKYDETIKDPPEKGIAVIRAKQTGKSIGFIHSGFEHDEEGNWIPLPGQGIKAYIEGSKIEGYGGFAQIADRKRNLLFPPSPIEQTRVGLRLGGNGGPTAVTEITDIRAFYPPTLDQPFPIEGAIKDYLFKQGGPNDLDIVFCGTWAPVGVMHFMDFCKDIKKTAVQQALTQLRNPSTSFGEVKNTIVKTVYPAAAELNPQAARKMLAEYIGCTYDPSAQDHLRQLTDAQMKTLGLMPHYLANRYVLRLHIHNTPPLIFFP